MGFAETFIEGFHAGNAARRQKEAGARDQERVDLEKQQFEERKKEAADRMKLEMDTSETHRKAQSLQEKLAYLQLQRMTPTSEAPHSMGPVPEDQMAPPETVDFDLGGKRMSVPVMHSEGVAAEKNAEFADQKNLLDQLEKVKFTGDLPEIGAKAGESYDPKEIAARTAVYGAKERRAASEAAGGKPHVVKIQDPRTGRNAMVWAYPDGHTVPLGDAAVNATTENRAIAANALISQGAEIKNFLSNPNVAKNIGPVLGRYNNLADFIGAPPPEYSQLAGEIESFALANMGVHGMRSVGGAEKIAKLLSGKHTPESLIAGIDGLLNFSHEYVKAAGMKESAPGLGESADGGKKTPEQELANLLKQ